MAHIHNQPGQHDLTVSALIVRKVKGEWKCFVHHHKKIDVLMQVGGHVELNETPWQAMAHELSEESGYTLKELTILQSTVDTVVGTQSVFHPLPLSINTHSVGNGHFHTDMAYAFVAKHEPSMDVAEGESSDLRWMTVQELSDGHTQGTVLTDTAIMYDFLLQRIENYFEVPALNFSLDSPHEATATYGS